MKNSRRAWMAVAGGLMMAGAAVGQVAIQPPGGGGMSIAPPGESATTVSQPAAVPATGPALPSAANVLQGLMNSQGAGGGAAMGGMQLIVPDGPPLGADGLLLEGTQLQLRGGHLKREGSGMMFVFDDKEKPAYPAMGAVPSRRLASMEDAAGFGEKPEGSDMYFRITAEVTKYRGKNYLYIKSEGIADQPAAGAATRAKPAENGPLVEAAAPHVPTATLKLQGDVITLRAARLVKDVKTGAELIAFDADGKQMTDPPMGVIPCQYLAVLEDATDFGNKPLKFIVSGEVTAYRGKNYLYLKFVKAVRDLNGGVGAGDTAGAVGAAGK